MLSSAEDRKQEVDTGKYQTDLQYCFIQLMKRSAPERQKSLCIFATFLRCSDERTQFQTDTPVSTHTPETITGSLYYRLDGLNAAYSAVRQYVLVFTGTSVAKPLMWVCAHNLLCVKTLLHIFH